MENTAYQQIIPMVPAFMTYEQAMVEQLRGVQIFREGKSLEARVEYAGGEKAVRHIESITKWHQGANQNDRVVHPLIAIKLVDVQYNNERYHPPESTWGKVWNSRKRSEATAVARVSKPAPYKVSYEWQFHAVYEEDMRYMMGQVMNRFHHHGGLDYVKILRSDGRTEWFPLHLRGFNVLTDSNTGEEDRDVRALMLVELEAYLPLPYKFVPVFRTYIQNMQMGRSPGEADKEAIKVSDQIVPFEDIPHDDKNFFVP